MGRVSMKRWACVAQCIAALLVIVMVQPLTGLAQDEGSSQKRRPDREENRREKRNERGRKSREGADMILPADVAELARLSVVLGRPTATSVTASVLSAEGGEAYCEYGPAPGRYTHRTNIMALSPGKPAEVLLDNLSANGRWHYRLRHRKQGDSSFSEGADRSFQTQRTPGSSFVFEVQGDSHPERRHQFDPALYARTLRAVAEDRPDFYLTMGDDFSVDTLATVNAQTVAGRYALQRPFLALVGQSAPLFLINGNHEQAAACNLDGTPDNVAVWAQTARNGYFPQPAPDGFYTGDKTPVPHIGLLRDYYAWTWGDALFVVIDPYWHSPKAVDNVYGGGEKTRDKWNVTLGIEQYQWLKRTLELSKAKFKFVFTHHVLGSGRGGIEQADLFEWGGKNKKGVDEFAQKRPGWALPIHQLMAKNGVTIFFQGHDHVFARQQLDGVVYQTLPEPADPSGALYFGEAFRSGDVLPNSGRVRVSVSAEKVRVEYVRSGIVQAGDTQRYSDAVAYSYEVAARLPSPM